MDDDRGEETYEVNNTGGILTVMRLLTGLLVGGLAGAGVMLLLAPQSGKRTRAQIRRKGRDLRKQATKSIESGANKVRAKAHQVRTDLQDQAEDLQQRGQDVVDNQKERWTPFVEAGKTAVQGS